MIEIGFFIGALIFFIAMSLTLAFTIFLYLHLVIAVKNNTDVPGWMYKIGHALKGRETDIYKDFTNKAALHEVNFYIISLVTASIAAYFIFYGKYFADDDIKFWLYAEFLIITFIRIAVYTGKALLNLIGKTRYNDEFSAATNAVIGMFVISIFTCVLTLTMTGLPVKAPIVQVEKYAIVIGHTTADELLANGFAFSGKTPNDMVKNKKNSHFYFGETVELTKDGEGYGYVNLTPVYQDQAILKDCIVTYFGISSKSKMFDSIKLGNQNISKLSLDYFEKRDMRDIFSLSPISYRESKGKEHYSLVMQTYPYMLWKRYNIEVTFFSNDNSNQFEVYAQHTLWE